MKLKMQMEVMNMKVLVMKDDTKKAVGILKNFFGNDLYLRKIKLEDTKTQNFDELRKIVDVIQFKVDENDANRFLEQYDKVLYCIIPIYENCKGKNCRNCKAIHLFAVDEL
jgi:RNA binding exosome subunit